MSATSVCATCGTTFTPPDDLLRRYPGWEPRDCPDCYRRGRREPGGGRPGGARRSRPAGAAPTLADVLERHEDGPQTGVFTDGSASPNPGPGGWGVVYVSDGEVVAQLHGHEAHTTNNRMELTAIREGIELVPEGTAVTVYTDSNLAVRTLTEWAPGWKAKGWRRKAGPVENLDLIRPLYERLRERPEITIEHIRAHAGYRWNEYADSLATAWMRETL